MNPFRAKHVILGVSIPFVLYALLGGFLAHVMAREDTAYRYLSVFQDVVSHIMHNYMSPPDMDKVMNGAIHGMMEGLDPDSVYLSPDEYATYKNNQQNPTAAVGIEIHKRYYLQVLSVIPGSSADEAGLKPGDLIKSIDGDNTREFNVVVGDAVLRGANGTTVELELVRSGTPDPIPVTLERQPIAASPVTYEMKDTTTGYLHLASYTATAAQDVKRAIEVLKRDGATQLVLDLRNSFGRDAEHGARVAEQFIAGGLAANLTRRDGEVQELRLSGDKVVFDGPMVVLINRGTAGPAEIIASAFAASERAELVGVVTAGRASVQESVELSDGSAVILSIAAYSTAEGKSLLGEGLEPTIEATAEAGVDDAILDRGLEVLEQAATKLKKAA